MLYLDIENTVKTVVHDWGLGTLVLHIWGKSELPAETHSFPPEGQGETCAQTTAISARGLQFQMVCLQLWLEETFTNHPENEQKLTTESRAETSSRVKHVLFWRELGLVGVWVLRGFLRWRVTSNTQTPVTTGAWLFRSLGLSAGPLAAMSPICTDKTPHWGSRKRELRTVLTDAPSSMAPTISLPTLSTVI